MSDKLESRVAVAFADGIATITLMRAARRNAFDEPMHDALREALSQIENTPSVRAVILTGSGPAFSAGQDLGERARTFDQGEVPDLRASLDDNYNPLVRRLVALPCPIIAAVNGIAFGAGAGLAIAADIVLCAASARFQFGFINIGLGPDCGTSWSLPKLVGQARALDLALTGRPVAAEEALAMGLVSRVVAEDQLMASAYGIASNFASRSPMALSSIKQQLRHNAGASLDMALDSERDAQEQLGRSETYREAVLHFAKPRK